MAIVVEGKTLCGICGQAIMSASQAIGFPAFLPDGHTYRRFSDAAFHETCFNRCPDRKDVEMVFEKYLNIWSNRPPNLTTVTEFEAWGRDAFKGL